MSFDSLMGYILSISMCMQNFITMFHSVQEIAPLSLFQNLELGKASTNEKCHFATSWARSCQYQCLRNSLSKYSTQLKRKGHFHFFRIWRSAKPRPMINVILQFLELDLVNINVSAKFYQNIPNGLRVKFHCFQNLNLGKPSTNPKCHLTTSWATSCQYQCVCKISSQYSTKFKRQGHFHFFRIWRSAKPRPMINVILQFSELDLVNINVSAKFYQNIPNGLRVKFYCF